jgi:hypothetical protein
MKEDGRLVLASLLVTVLLLLVVLGVLGFVALLDPLP